MTLKNVYNQWIFEACVILGLVEITGECKLYDEGDKWKRKLSIDDELIVQEGNENSRHQVCTHLCHKLTYKHSHNLLI